MDKVAKMALSNHILLAALALAMATLAGCKGGDGKARAAKQPAAVEAKAAPADTSAVRHLTTAEFVDIVYDFRANPDEWVYKGDKPAIVDFYATWCPPCKQLSPLLEKLAAEHSGAINIYKVDIDEEPELAAAFGISSIPMLLWIPAEGKPFVTMGLMPKPELDKTVAERLLKVSRNGDS